MTPQQQQRIIKRRRKNHGQVFTSPIETEEEKTARRRYAILLALSFITFLATLIIVSLL